MSQAEDLLNSLEDELSYITDPSVEEHIVVGQDRIITVPRDLKRIAVQHDHNVETVTFDCPRYWDGIDMSEMAIYINYLRSDGESGIYAAENICVDEEDESVMHFEWTISRNVTFVSGNLSFSICIKDVDESGEEIVHWNTEICKELYVSTGMECSEVVEESQQDILTQILKQLDDIGVSLDGATSFVVDDALSEESTNPVQNKVITREIRQMETTVGNIDALLETI